MLGFLGPLLNKPLRAYTLSGCNNRTYMYTQEYKELISKLHAETPDWGTSGYRHLDPITTMIGQGGLVTEETSLIDVGCGKGALIEVIARYYEDISIQGYDPFVPKFATLPTGKFDYVISTDVLEHIEPQKLDEFFKFLADLTKKTGEAYLVISLVSAKQILPDGRNAHLIIETSDWWILQAFKWFSRVGIVQESRQELVLRCKHG